MIHWLCITDGVLCMCAGSRGSRRCVWCQVVTTSHSWSLRRRHSRLQLKMLSKASRSRRRTLWKYHLPRSSYYIRHISVSRSFSSSIMYLKRYSLMHSSFCHDHVLLKLICSASEQTIAHRSCIPIKVFIYSYTLRLPLRSLVIGKTCWARHPWFLGWSVSLAGDCIAQPYCSVFVCWKPVPCVCFYCCPIAQPSF